MKEELTGRLIQIASDVFGVSTDVLTLDSSSESIEAWDSISHLNLMLAVEEAFGVRIEAEQMVELTSLDRIAALISQPLPR